MINALKLLANQQRDGDSPILSIVTGLCEKQQERGYGGPEKLVLKLTITVPSMWAVKMKVSGLLRCEGQSSERGPPGRQSGSPEELTLRAEEVGTQKSCMNVGHIAEDRWGPPLVDADWHACGQAISK